MNDVSADLAAAFAAAEPATRVLDNDLPPEVRAALDDLPDTFEIELEPHITFQKKEFTSLKLCAPKVKDLVRAEKILRQEPHLESPSVRREHAILLVAAVSQTPREVIDELPEATLERAYNFLAAIRVKSRRTIENWLPISPAGGGGDLATRGT